MEAALFTDIHHPPLTTALSACSQVLDKAFDLAMDGPPEQAKYAATFLAAVPDNQEQCEDLVKVGRVLAKSHLDPGD